MELSHDLSKAPLLEIVRPATLAQVIAVGEHCAQEIFRDYRDIRTIAPAGSYERLPPLLLDDEEATEQTKQMLAQYSAVLRQGYSERLALSLLGAHVAGQGAAVTRAGALIAESVIEFTAHGRVPDGLVKVDGDGYGLRQVTRRIDRPCLLAKRPWYRNYGHFLVDCVTVMAMASSAGLSDGTTIVIGCYEHPAMERVVRRTIEEFFPGAEVLVHPDNEVWEFDTLWYVAPLHVPPLFKLPDGLRAVRTHLISSVNTSFTSTRRLFVSRGNSGNRLLLNENELLGLCVKCGFDLVFPERLSLTEQAALFHDAQIVVGVKGAALSNAMFMSQGAALIVLSPADFPDPFFWDICGQLNVAYVEIFGSVTTARGGSANDFRISPEKLRAALSLVGAPL